MSKLSLLEIAQSQLDTTPVVDGQLIVCLDTGNAYRDNSVAHVKIGNDLEVVSELPLAPLAEKLYYLKPNKLYSYLGGNWVLLNDDFSIKTNKSALNGDAKIILDGSKKTSVALKGSGVATVVTDSDGQLVVNSPDPNTILEHITNNEIDTMIGKIVVPDEDKSVTIDPSLSNPGQVADAKATGDAIREEVERAKKVENEIKNDINNRFVSQNILVGTETGNPISVDDAFPAPLCGLTVYGRSTQDGTPTPDAPVPIVSAGDGGSVAVKVTGKNLLKIRNGKQTTRGITVSATDGLLSISGTATETGWAALDIDLFDASGTVILSSSVNTPKAVLVSPAWKTVLEQSKSATATDTIGKICFTVTQGQTYNLTGVKLQLELGTAATTYSPYREQLLTLPTPTGLPGIPVTSGGNYTDPQGQQWVCDEVDLERGVKVQRIYKVDVDGENAKFVQAGDYANLVPRGIPIALYNHVQKIYATSTFTNLSWFYNTVNGQFLYLIAANLADQLNASCKKQLGKVYYALDTPIETPLTPDEIAAYKALTAYGPDTVVQAGDGAGIKLEYQRDVNLVVKNLEDAIASMT